ncbi:MAG: hypothetical protein AAF739_03260 [Pseudomonadota bacterium]
MAWLASFFAPVLGPLGALLRLLAPDVVGRVLDTLDKRTDAQTESAKLKTRVIERAIDAQTDRLRIHAAMPWWHPMMIIGYAVAFLIVKLIVWDTALGLGSTPNPGAVVLELMDTVVMFYFGAAGAIGVASVIASVIGGRR